MYGTNKRKVAARAGAALALSIGVLAASVSVASAETNDSGRVWGTVSAASATSITVTNRVGVSSTFSITTTTKVLEGWTTVTTAALMTGEHVTVLPTSEASGVAARIRIFLSAVQGRVSAVSGDNITLTKHDGLALSVVASSATTFTLGDASATLSDVTVGSWIRARGVVDTSANALDPLHIHIAMAGRAAYVIGTVSAVSGEDITLTLPNGLKVSVVANGATTFTKGGKAATLADVIVGARIEAIGTVDTTANALDATRVRIGDGDGDADDPGLGLGAGLNTGHSLSLDTQFRG
jgi:Domain of unknown function (DUF5666)